MITPESLGLDVSRETLDRLNIYLALLHKWNPKINLVARGTLDNAIDRHFRDSAQLITLHPQPAGSWVDIGSGGGFPGLLIAILLVERAPDIPMTLIESDMRKATFLRSVIRETGLSCRVLTQRIENSPPQNAAIVSARALAPLSLLLSFANRHLAPDGRALFMKGETWGKEIEDARSQWQFSCIEHTSRTNSNAVVLEIGDIFHV